MTTRRAWLVTFLCFTLVGGTWALVMPLVAQPDEPAHAVRAAAVARGQVTWLDRRTKGIDETGWYVTTETDVEVPVSWASLDLRSFCLYDPVRRPADCVPPIDRDSDVVRTSLYTGTYPPFVYAYYGIASYLPAGAGLYGMRLLDVVAAAALFATGLAVVRRRGGRWLAVGAALGLTPVALSLMGAVNPSGVEIAAAFAVWMTALDLFDTRSTAPASGWAFTVSAVVLALVRPVSMLLLVVILLVVVIAVGDRERWRALVAERAAKAWAAAIGGAIVLALVWAAAAQSIGAVTGAPQHRPLLNQIGHELSLIPDRIDEMVGVMGWLDVYLPNGVSWLWSLAVLAFVGWAFVVGTRRQRFALAVVLLGTLLGPAVAELPSAAAIGTPWQGRYSLPIALGVPILAGWVLLERRADGWPRRASVGKAAIICVAVVDALAMVFALSRYDSGTELPISFPLGPQGWTPMPGVVLVALVLVANAALAWSLLRLAGDAVPTSVQANGAVGASSASTSSSR